MPEPKQPQDRKPKALKASDQGEGTLLPDRVQVVKWEDHAYRIDPKRLDDISFMELLSEMDVKSYYIAKVVAHMLGADQWESFKKDHADEEGLLSSDRVSEFFTAVSEQMSLGN